MMSLEKGNGRKRNVCEMKFVAEYTIFATCELTIVEYTIFATYKLEVANVVYSATSSVSQTFLYFNNKRN